MISPELASRLTLVVIAAISLRMLRENTCVLISYATVLISKNVSGVGFLTFSQTVIDELTAPTSAARSVMFVDARILHRHLSGIRRSAAVYIFPGSRACACALLNIFDRVVVEGPAAQHSHAAKAVILWIGAVRIFAARCPAVALDCVGAH